MASFGEALKKALAGMSNDFVTARNDLVEEVADVSKQVEELTLGKVKLALELQREDEDGAILSLVMLNEEGLHQEVTGFSVRLSGYPIISAPTRMLKMRVEGLAKSTPIQNRQGIREFFTQLASDRNSPLVRKLAFVLRNM